jgi:uncharacterized protein (TIGR02246 family)
VKKYLLVIPLVLLLCLAPGCHKGEEMSEEPAVDVGADIEAIKALISEASRTWNEGDYEGYMAIIDEEAVFLPPDAPPFEGMETIRSEYLAAFDAFEFNVAITTKEIHVCGELAFSLDNWKGSMIPKDGSKPIAFDNKNLVITRNKPTAHGKLGVPCTVVTLRLQMNRELSLIHSI